MSGGSPPQRGRGQRRRVPPPQPAPKRPRRGEPGRFPLPTLPRRVIKPGTYILEFCDAGREVSRINQVICSAPKVYEITIAQGNRVESCTSMGGTWPQDNVWVRIHDKVKGHFYWRRSLRINTDLRSEFTQLEQCGSGCPIPPWLTALFLHAEFHYNPTREDADTDTEGDGQEAVNAPASQDGSATAEFADESDSESQVVGDPSPYKEIPLRF